MLISRVILNKAKFRPLIATQFFPCKPLFMLVISPFLQSAGCVSFGYTGGRSIKFVWVTYY